MASKTTLNAQNLEALGAGPLAELLVDVAMGDANTKRRLRMELIGRDNPFKLATEIRKRLNAIAASETFVGWRSLKAFRSDLHNQRSLIRRLVAPAAPQEAVALLWQFYDLSDSVLERTNDSSGELLTLFSALADDIAQVAVPSERPSHEMIAQVCHTLLRNGYGQADALIGALATVLGNEGLKALRSALTDAGRIAAKPVAPRARRASRWKRGRKLEYESIRHRSRAEMLHIALEAVADALGDVDAYTDLQTDPRDPDVALKVARRLVTAGRPADALSRLDNARGGREARAPEWDALYVMALERGGRDEDAQRHRLNTFRRTLDPGMLRAYLKRLPDFEDIEIEEAELDRALSHPQALLALELFISWPSLDRAARLVIARLTAFRGDEETRLAPCAERLAGKYPLAAVQLFRRMAEARLASGLPSLFEGAATHFWESERLDALIDDHDGTSPHRDWASWLRKTFPRCQEFWSLVDSS